MKPLYDGDGYILSTGKTFYANNGYVGLSPQGDYVSEGYDGSVDLDRFSRKELEELAEYMIGAWSKFLVNVKTNNLYRDRT